MKLNMILRELNDVCSYTLSARSIDNWVPQRLITSGYSPTSVRSFLGMDAVVHYLFINLVYRCWDESYPDSQKT